MELLTKAEQFHQIQHRFLAVLWVNVLQTCENLFCCHRSIETERCMEILREGHTGFIESGDSPSRDASEVLYVLNGVPADMERIFRSGNRTWWCIRVILSIKG